MTQSLKHLTLDFGSGDDLMFHEIEPCVGLCADNMDPAWDPLFPTLSAPPPLMHALSLKISKQKL